MICSTLRNIVFVFVGLTEPGFKNYTFVLTSMTWEDAQKYCRQHHTDLAMIENQAENIAVASIASGNVWLGLYRKPWRWSDGSTNDFASWATNRPNNYGRVQHCAWENSYHDWNDFSCSSLYPFFCHRGEENLLMGKDY
uniref:C-type lectin domain-containing protein n=1 Tax=Periophthalmus magnuspinnatus TaxID=409849 RepID=A0A3B3ZC42_9GOBI